MPSSGVRAGSGGSGVRAGSQGSGVEATELGVEVFLGGLVTTIGDDRLHTWHVTGELTKVVGGEVTQLVVGGGAGGGHGSQRTSGGGAGGRVRTGTLAISADQTITVGSGGAASVSPPTGSAGSPGGTSSIGALSVAEGGSGGGGSAAGNQPGVSGGVHGGGGQHAGVGGDGTIYDGGSGYNSANASLNFGGGGGAGAGGNGGTAHQSSVTPGSAGAGGPGVSSDITGSSLTYGAGGGGGAEQNNATAYNGGPAGGSGAGRGTGPDGAATSGTNGFGGGGGGGSSESGGGSGGSGGSGVVMIRYPHPGSSALGGFPLDIDGLYFWVNPANVASIDTSSSFVLGDLSGNKLHATQATEGNKPSTGVDTINGLNVITNTNGKYLDTTHAIPLGVTRALTIVMVVEPDSVADDNLMGIYPSAYGFDGQAGVQIERRSTGKLSFTYGTGSLAAFNSTQFRQLEAPSANSGRMVIVATIDPTGVAFRANGVPIIMTGTAGSMAVGSFMSLAAYNPYRVHLGGRDPSGTEFGGTYGDVMVFLRVLTLAEIERIEGEMRDKYALPVAMWDGGSPSVVGSDSVDGGSASVVGADTMNGGSP